MISINDNKLSFVHMGLFDRTGEWIHPTVMLDTYELIFVLDGTVELFEGKEKYILKRGQMIVLYPNVEHGGIRKSFGHTSFYWLHFKTDNFDAFALPKMTEPDAIRMGKMFREIMQFHQAGSRTLAEVTLARLLLDRGDGIERKSKIAYEMSEFIRINSYRSVTVEELSSKFGYDRDHISRILKSEFGVNAKTMIVDKRLSYIESLLINTNDTVKEISSKCGFEDENLFLKFFKYHEGKTPTQYRDEFYRVHMNSK